LRPVLAATLPAGLVCAAADLRDALHPLRAVFRDPAHRLVFPRRFSRAARHRLLRAQIYPRAPDGAAISVPVRAAWSFRLGKAPMTGGKAFLRFISQGKWSFIPPCNKNNRPGKKSTIPAGTVKDRCSGEMT